MAKHKCIQDGSGESVKAGDHLQDPDLDGRMILKCILGK